MSSIKKNFFYNTLTQVSTVLGPLIIFPYVTRVLGPENYGLVSFANSFIQYFIVIATVGVPYYGIRMIAMQKDNIIARSKVFSEIIIIHSILSIVVALLYLIIILTVPKFYSNLNYYYWGILMICIFPLNIYWFFTGIEDFKYVAIRTCLLQILQVILVFLFVRNREDGLIFFLIPVFINVLTVFVNLRRGNKFLTFTFDRKTLEFRKHFKPLFLIFLFTASTSMIELLDSVILGIISTNTAVSYYAIANRINKVPTTFISVLSPVLMPRMTYASTKGDNNEMSKLINLSVSFTLLLAIPIFIGLFVLSPELIMVFSGSEFTLATTTMKIMSPTSVVLGLANIFIQQVLLPLSKDKEALVSAILGMITSISLNLLLTPTLKQNGAAISNIIANSIIFVTSFYFSSKSIAIKFNFKEIIFNLIAASTFFPIIALIRSYINESVIVLIISIIICAILYFLLQNLIFKNTIVIQLSESLLFKYKSKKK